MKATVLELNLPLPSTKTDENDAINGYEVMEDGEEGSGVEVKSDVEDQSDNQSYNNNDNDLSAYAAPQANPDETKEPVDQNHHSPSGTRSNLAATSLPTPVASAAAAESIPPVECGEVDLLQLLRFNSQQRRQEFARLSGQDREATISRLRVYADSLDQKIQQRSQQKAAAQKHSRGCKNLLAHELNFKTSGNAHNATPLETEVEQLNKQFKPHLFEEKQLSTREPE